MITQVGSAQAFADAVAAAVGNDLVAIIQHGDPPVLRRDPVHLLMVLEPLRLPTLQTVGRLHQEHRRHVELDLVFFTPGELKSSLDVFPIEFVEMQRTRRVLRGQDVLEGLEVAPSDLRLQLEQDLKTKRLWLRQRFSYMAARPRDSAALPQQAFPALRPVLRALLHYVGQPVPNGLDALLKAASETFALDGDFLAGLARGRAVNDSVERYLQVLELLLARVEN